MARDRLFLLLGGPEGCVKLATLFYGEVERDPVLRPLFGKKFLEPIRKLAAYLSQLAGGPQEHSRTRWSLSLREAHRRFAIGPAERDASDDPHANGLDADRPASHKPTQRR